LITARQRLKQSFARWLQNNVYRRSDGAICGSQEIASWDQQNIVMLLITPIQGRI